MRFDDRLATVLGLDPEGSHQRVIQWRQLVELVARGAARGQPDLREQALQRIAVLMGDVSEHVRAAAARAIAGPDVPAELVALFAANGIEAAAPLLTSAELDEAGWAAVDTVASPRVGAMLTALRRESPLAEAVVDGTSEPAASKSPPLAATVGAHSPNYLVARGAGGEGRPSAGLFRWECGPDGQIDWVDGVSRTALIGQSLPGGLQNLFAARLPFEDEHVSLVAEQGVMTGEWLWSGAPAFLPGSGLFAGYRGWARKAWDQPAARGEPEAATLDDDALRELVHELRTPLNAIIGFGDIIGGQFLGPAHLPYRERATEIVNQGRRLLDAVEDLDLAAKLRSGRSDAGREEPFNSFFPVLRLELLEQAAKQDVLLTVSVRNLGDRDLVPAQVAERLLRRLLFAVLAAAAPGEGLELVVDRLGQQLIVAVGRPQVISGLTEEHILGTEFSPRSPAAATLGFILRLTRGLATVIGGSLDLSPDRLLLHLPTTRA